MYEHDYCTFLMRIDTCRTFLALIDEEPAESWLKELQELQQALEYFFEGPVQNPYPKRGEEIIWWMLNTNWATNPERYRKFIEVTSLTDWEKEWLSQMYSLTYEVTELFDANLGEFGNACTEYGLSNNKEERAEIQANIKILVSRNSAIEMLWDFVVYTAQDVISGEINAEDREFFFNRYVKEKEELEIEVFGELCLHESV